MPSRLRRRLSYIDVPVHDMTLRVAGTEDLYEEVRAMAMHFWEMLQSYSVRHPGFQRSKRPISVPEPAPQVVREMARLAATAGVGPIFTFQGALTEYVGQALAQVQPEVNVSCGGDHYLVARHRAKLAIQGGPPNLAVVIRPELGPQGVYTAVGGSAFLGRSADGLVVVASSCILADAAAAAATAILARPQSMRTALSFLQKLRGVHGAMVVRGEQIGVAGRLELAA
jgi:ApbE superfamily uncharacterized protein (UPF0280 family)